MALYHQYLEQSKFGSYEDFLKNYRIIVPERFNFAYDVLDRMASETPDQRALVWVPVEGETLVFTYADVKRESDRAACVLQRLGIRKGDAVMLILKRHFEFWFMIMALHKLGAVTIPATHLLTEKDLVYRCNAAHIKLVVATSQSGVADSMDAARAQCPSVKELMIVRGQREGWLSFDRLMAETPAEFTKPEAEGYACDQDPMLLYFTSGTTGMPKMVRMSCTYPLGHIATAVYWLQCIEGGLHLTVSETGWAKSVWGKLYGQWLAGCAVFVYDFDKFVAGDLLRVVAENQVTTFCAPPTIYRFLVQEDLAAYNLAALKHCAVAGEPLNPEVYNKWLSMTNIQLMEAYGQTELCVTLATFPWMRPCPGSMGKPSPQFDVDLVDEEGESCAAGVSGEVVVRTRRGTPVGMFAGYYEDPALTDSVWHDGMYHTGDVAWRDEWGYYWFVGRTDDVIKSSGYRIGPFEVESALMEHPAVMETAIIGVPDETRGQVIKATVVLAKGYEPCDELAKELKEHVKRITAPYKYPRIIEFAAELPKTISGKIRRVELREQDKKG